MGLKTDPGKRMLELMPALGRFCSAPEGARRFGVTPAQARLLESLAMRGPLAMGEISKRLGMTMPSATELVDRLIEKGLAERVADAADRRVVRVRLAATMSATIDRLMAVYRVKVEQAMEKLDPPERLQLVELLEKLLRNTSGKEA